MRSKILTNCFAVASFIIIANSEGHASNCEMLDHAVDESRTQLKRASDEDNFNSAKDYMRRARNALDDASMGAMDCRCITAQIEFDDSATYAKRARDASSPKEFNNLLNRSIGSFNSALHALRTCR